jgi:hypothetical protein
VNAKLIMEADMQRGELPTFRGMKAFHKTGIFLTADASRIACDQKDGLRPTVGEPLKA